MPELPEVETVRRQLAGAVVGAHITAVDVTPGSRWSTVVAAVGARIDRVGRRGKYLLLALDDGRDVVVHLGMTGQVHWQRTPVDHCRLCLHTDKGTLHLRDPRGFGRADVVERGDHRAFPTLHALGPEPLETGFDLDAAAAVLSRTGGPVKGRLLAQRALAGVGNYVADEALWRAGVHPASRAVDKEQARSIVRAVREVMVESLAAGGVSERDYEHIDGGTGAYADELDCYGRSGQPCRICGTVLVRSVISGRGTTWCPVCQKEPAAGHGAPR